VLNCSIVRRRLVWSAALGTIAWLGAQDVRAQDSVHVYQANFAASPPSIDGFLTSPEEWAAASVGGDEWKLMTTGTADTTNNRFAMLWDGNGLYLQHQVDYGGWQNRGATWDSLYESLNLYFDPNVDGEPNDATDVFGNPVPDGYHLAVNEPLGDSEISQVSVTAGMDGEFYVNSLFGTPSSWLPNITMKQSNSVQDKVGYLEMFIPWDQFNKTDPNGGGIDPERDEIGLFHPQAPANGEEWFFNMTRVQTNGLLPTWNSPPGAFFFSMRPHGILQFVGTAGPACDIDQDGACDGGDIDAIAIAVRDGVTEARFDQNQDGAVNDADRVFYVEKVLNTWIGDSNLDGQFGTQDFVAVLIVGGYEDGIPGNSTWASGDWNGDLDFTTNDFVAALISGGFEMGPRPVGAVAAVPEPATATLLLLGGAPLLNRVRRWRRSGLATA
jgi:hypothetical protein